jgi:hypothetical protein
MVVENEMPPQPAHDSQQQRIRVHRLRPRLHDPIAEQRWRPDSLSDLLVKVGYAIDGDTVASVH